MHYTERERLHRCLRTTVGFAQLEKGPDFVLIRAFLFMAPQAR